MLVPLRAAAFESLLRIESTDAYASEQGAPTFPRSLREVGILTSLLRSLPIKVKVPALSRQKRTRQGRGTRGALQCNGTYQQLFQSDRIRDLEFLGTLSGHSFEATKVRRGGRSAAIVQISFSGAVCIAILDPQSLGFDETIGVAPVEARPNALVQRIQLRVGGISCL